MKYEIRVEASDREEIERLRDALDGSYVFDVPETVTETSSPTRRRVK